MSSGSVTSVIEDPNDGIVVGLLTLSALPVMLLTVYVSRLPKRDRDRRPGTGTAFR
jgi:hypothetical protein